MLQFELLDEKKKFLMLEDIRDYHPEYDPYVFLGSVDSNKHEIEKINGNLEEFVGIISFLIPVNQKVRAVNNFSYENSCFHYSGRPYLEDNGTYIFGEVFKEDDVEFEAIINERSFEGLDLFYYEPTDRLIKYLNLHREDNNWIDPYTNDIIIKTGDTNRNTAKCNRFLSIRKSELIDYLAARKCGLLVLRYSNRILKTPHELTGLPEPYDQIKTKNGRQSWIIDRDFLDSKSRIYFSRLWESFWIDPASYPKMGIAQSLTISKEDVPFQLGNGESSTYNQGGKYRYFEVISFNPRFINTFLSSPHNKIKFTGLSILNLSFADASSLTMCINKEGQFQTYFGFIKKNIDANKQKLLTTFSEPQKAKISAEFYRVTINGEWLNTMPFNRILSNCLKEINIPWKNKFNETLILSPEEDDIPAKLLIGPTSSDFNELIDIMLEFQKLIIPESEIKNIKDKLNYSSFVPNTDDYKKMKSIGYTKLLFKANGPDKMEGESYILSLINQLRNCKGHPKDVNKTLREYNILEKNPRTGFLFIMAEFCKFLSAFKNLTEKIFDMKFKDADYEEHKSPWIHLNLAQAFFTNPN